MSNEDKSTTPTLARRDWLRRFGMTAAAAVTLPLAGAARAAVTPPPARRRSLRVAHLTDVHVQPERGAAEGFARCLRHVQSQPDRPDLIVMTGDCVYDSFGQDRGRTQLQWDLWSRVLKAECSLPVVPLLGNHDIWGWNKKKSGTTGGEPGYGKRWACDALGLDRPYYSVDRGGWHFVMLDSVQPWAERAYTAHLDEAQMDWLRGDLAASAGKPTMVCSHVPILSITPIMAQKPEDAVGKNGEPNTTLGHAVMHSDWRDLKALFKQRPDVRLAVSGHLHLIDEVTYGGVSYCCNGAVSGGWWKEAHLGEGDAGYALLDLYDDGTFDRAYATYGWQYQGAPATKPASTTMPA